MRFLNIENKNKNKNKNKIQEVKNTENVFTLTLEDGTKIPFPLFMDLGPTYVGHNDKFVITKNEHCIPSFIPNDGSIKFFKNK